MSPSARIGILNISDRASRKIYEDTPGKTARKLLDDYLITEWTCEYAVIPDEREIIEAHLIEFIDQRSCSLVLTTGGTGPAPRDVTPEATEAVCEKMLPGFGELMRATSLQYVPTAILSRQTAGIRRSGLIVNLPGKPRAISQCLDAVFPAIPYCLDLIGGDYLECNPDFVRAFRPKTS